MKKFLSITLMLVMALALFWSAPVAADRKVLTYGEGAEPVSLDASITTDSMGGAVLYHLSEGLLRVYDGNIIPGVAKEWEISADGLTYTFYLRDSAWEDGEPVTAYDFVYSFLRFIHPETASPVVEIAYDIVNAAAFNKGEIDDPSLVGVEALAEKTFRITLTRPVPYFLWVLATRSYFYPLRQDFVEARGRSYAIDEKNFLANGPFRLKEWQHGSSLHWEKNENYWNAEAINLDEIVQLIIPDNNTRLIMFDNEELDFVPVVAPGHVARYPDAKTRYHGAISMLQFNMAGTTPAAGRLVANKNFRLALSYAINRDAFNVVAVGPYAESANRFTHPEIWAINDTFVNEYPLTGTVPTSGDPEQAKAYLALALDELGLTIDRLPKLTFLSFEVQTRRVIAEALIDIWESVLGLKNIEIKIMPIPQAIQSCAQRTYDIYYQSISTDIDPYIFLAYWVSTGGINWTGWGSATFDSMMAEVNNILDPAARFALLQKAEQYLLDNGPFVPLNYDKVVYVYHDYVTNIVATSVGVHNQLIYADITR